MLKLRPMYSEKQIQEQAEKLLQERKGDGVYMHEDDVIGAMNDLAQWMQEREKSEAHSLKMALIEIKHCAQTLEQAKQMASEELNEPSPPKD